MAADMLVELLGCPLSVVFLHVPSCDLPVVQVDAHLRLVGAQSLTLELDAGLPSLEQRTRFGVYAASQRGLVQFQTQMTVPYEPGSRILTLARPTSVQTLQRRQFSRVPFETPIRYCGPAACGEGLPLNLSSGGLAFRAFEPLALSAPITLALHAPQAAAQQLQQIRASVCRCDQRHGGWEIAVQFFELTAAQQTALFELVWRGRIRHRERVSIF